MLICVVFLLLLPFGHFLVRLSYAFELLLPLDKLVLTLLCHIPPVFFRSALPPRPSFFQAQKNPEAFIAGSGVGRQPKPNLKALVCIDLSAADVKD